MFEINQNKGFKMVFANGWTVSVQFGYGNYCDSRSFDKYDYNRTEAASSTTAEIAAWDANDKWYDFGNDTVAGYKTVEEVMDFMNMIRML